ncbi:hypothetical protein COCON_G00116800 [Conger conger]|uniref:Uncharacterized protein n=1 Tax=Conger conger TaxID=82655 RepID=A0A9Q1DG23_CONCO|nr:hypothetical protein COCON_G00116800 [Conger conger]
METTGRTPACDFLLVSAVTGCGFVALRCFLWAFRRDRASLGRSRNVVMALQDVKHHSSSSSSSRHAPYAPFDCLSPEAPPPGP